MLSFGGWFLFVVYRFVCKECMYVQSMANLLRSPMMWAPAASPPCVFCFWIRILLIRTGRSIMSPNWTQVILRHYMMILCQPTPFAPRWGAESKARDVRLRGEASVSFCLCVPRLSRLPRGLLKREHHTIWRTTCYYTEVFNPSHYASQQSVRQKMSPRLSRTKEIQGACD